VVLVSSGGTHKRELRYDHLLALGSLTDTGRIHGSELAFTFKTLADAILLRNHVIERMSGRRLNPTRTFVAAS
jgi:NADH dehydrogenase FAD-containing subunit